MTGKVDGVQRIFRLCNIIMHPMMVTLANFEIRHYSPESNLFRFCNNFIHYAGIESEAK